MIFITLHQLCSQFLVWFKIEMSFYYATNARIKMLD